MLTSRIARPLVPASASLFSGGGVADLVSLEDVKLELDIARTGDDVWLSKAITRASIAAANYCNRVFQPTLWQDQVWPGHDAYPWQLPPRLNRLQLSQFPVLSTPSPACTAPPVAPELAASADGSLAAQTVYVRISFVTPYGETAPSLESRIALAAGQVFTVLAPVDTEQQVATGWNVYAGTAPFVETLQNAAPIAMGTSWTLPTYGLTTTGTAPPNYATVVENAVLAPVPLCEGRDFEIDATLGQMTRFFPTDHQPRSWGPPILAVYSAGFASIPQDLQDAVILMVKGRYFSRRRDPNVRSENIEGVYEAQYFFATGPGGQGDLSVDAMAKLDRFRPPVMA